MKLHAKNLKPVIRVHRQSTRPVILHIARLTFTMTAAEAFALADQLADAAEETQP